MFLWNNKNKGFHLSLLIASLVGLGIIITCFYVLISQSIDVSKENGFLSMLISQDWDPYSESYGLLPMLIGSSLSGLGALLISLPFSVMLSVYVVLQSSRYLKSFVLAIMGIMLAVPSVVYGLWGLSVFSPLFLSWKLPAMNLCLGILVLSLMLIPTMSAVMIFGLENQRKRVQRSIEALGLSSFRQIFKIYLPSQKKNIIFASVLGLAKALGETMAILMVSGNIAQVPNGLFAPMRSLTANVALEMAYAMDEHRASLYLSGLVLMLVVCALAAVSYRFSSDNFEPKTQL